ncbi:MAG: hypothetical protein V4733_07090 [Verrucomicrobiota bacterium]
MHVPWYAVVPLCIVTVPGAWWLGAKDKDFMTPPSERRLQEIRGLALAALPKPDQQGALIQAKTGSVATPAETQPSAKPKIHLGDLTAPPKLADYALEAEKGAEYLISLALLLEGEGEFLRALSAWERVIDHALPTDSQRQAAVSSIERLRPTLPAWNTDETKAALIILHAGAGKKSAELLKPHLEAMAEKLEDASSGIVRVNADIAASRTDLSRSGAAPVAIWISGPDTNAPSTEVMSFTFEKPDELPSQLVSSVFTLLRGYLFRNTTLAPVPELPADRINERTLKSSITRYAWKNLSVLLNRPAPNAPKPPEAVKPQPTEKPKPVKPKIRRSSSKPQPAKRSNRNR